MIVINLQSQLADALHVPEVASQSNGSPKHAPRAIRRGADYLSEAGFRKGAMA
jgi:hypothetical protein